MLLDVCGNDDRLYLLELDDPVLFAPLEKLRDSVSVGRTRVFIADVRGEEFDKAPGRTFAGASDRSWQLLETGWSSATRP